MALPDPIADANRPQAPHGHPNHAAQAAFPVPIKVIRPSCFRTDERLRCRKTGCSWREDCCRLVAEWKR